MNRPPPIEPESLLRCLRPRAILRGFLWDNGLTIALACVLAAYLLDGSPLDASEEAIDELLASRRFNLPMLIGGLSCTVLGGYLAASRAGVCHVVNGAAVGAANLALAASALLVPESGPAASPWFDALGYALVVPAAALGGSFARRPAA